MIRTGLFPGAAVSIRCAEAPTVSPDAVKILNRGGVGSKYLQHLHCSGATGLEDIRTYRPCDFPESLCSLGSHLGSGSQRLYSSLYCAYVLGSG